MEVSVVSEKSIKVKAKNVTFLINPEKKVDDEVVLLTKKPEDYSGFDGKIVFDGPGEYEVGGVSIKGDFNNGHVSFDLLDDRERLLIMSSSDVEKSKGAEDYTATIVFAENDVDNEALSKITSGVVVAVGNISEGENIKKTDKLNLKKIEDYKGVLVHLTKN